MGIYLGIKKERELGTIIYYRVIASDFPGVSDFFIGVDRKKSLILFFKQDSLSKEPDYIVDLKNREQKLGVEWLPPRVVYHICSKVQQALGKPSMPDDISYCA